MQKLRIVFQPLIYAVEGPTTHGMHPHRNFILQPSLKSFASFVGTLLLAIAAIVVFTTASASAASCRDAEILPATQAEIKRAEAATRCLINNERRKRGLATTRLNKKLHKAALWQAKDMLRHEYFDHNRSGGPSFVGRISRFGYGRNSNGYSLGENLGWAPNSVATPSEMVRMWMESPGHRANILHRKFREQAVSAVYSDGDVGGDYEDSGGPFVLYVSQFGKRY